MKQVMLTRCSKDDVLCINYLDKSPDPAVYNNPNLWKRLTRLDHTELVLLNSPTIV
jgi:hypothetical protein